HSGEVVAEPEPVSCVQPTTASRRSSPSAPLHRTNLTLPPLDLKSSILVVLLVSHVSESSTIRTAFALPRRDDNGAETSTRLAEKRKARSRRNLGIVLPHYSKIRWQTGGKQDSYRLDPTPSRRKQCMGRGRTTPCSNQPGRCATRIDLWRLGSALRRTRVG